MKVRPLLTVCEADSHRCCAPSRELCVVKWHDKRDVHMMAPTTPARTLCGRADARVKGGTSIVIDYGVLYTVLVNSVNCMSIV